MSNIATLHQHVEKGYRRLFELYQNASTSCASLPDLLPIALKELGIICEQLQVALQELNYQTQKLRESQMGLQMQQCLHQQLFQLSSNSHLSHLIVDRSGMIQAANSAAAELFHTTQSLLVGRSLLSLVTDGDQALLRDKLAELANRRIDCSVTLDLHSTHCLSATLTLTPLLEGQDSLLGCSLRTVSPQQPAMPLEQDPGCQGLYNTVKGRSLYHFNRSEIIPLEPHMLWFITQGEVKLTTLAMRGEEILVGIAGPSMVFGPSLTHLPVYQATALSKVKLASISLPELTQTQELSQALVKAVSERLRQTEAFLSIHGQLRVEDRLKQLLLLLKQSFGQPTEMGTRLNLRLTHQDLASACCTTRVTITRLLSKLQQEDLLKIDAQNHLIISDALCL